MKTAFASFRRLAVVAGMGAAAWAGAMPSTAQACSCFPYVDVQWPAAGQDVAANDLIVLQTSCGGSSSDLVVLVDGEPAALVADEDRMGGMGFVITPEPAVGATVEIEGCPGYASCEQAAELGLPAAERIELSFVVGERDDAEPQPPVLAALSYTIEEAWIGGCGDDESYEPAREWSFVIDGQEPAESVIYQVELGPADGDPTRTRRFTVDGQAQLDLTLQRLEEDAGSTVCATVRTFDMAGNEANTVSSCQALDRDETLDGMQGCTCSAEQGARGAWGAALLLLLGGWSRRRRAR